MEGDLKVSVFSVRFCVESDFPCGNRVKSLWPTCNISPCDFEPTLWFVLSNGVPKG